jgi:hypothetical protein
MGSEGEWECSGVVAADVRLHDLQGCSGCCHGGCEDGACSEGECGSQGHADGIRSC